MKKIFIVTGEASGDKLASTVISNLNKLNTNQKIEFTIDQKNNLVICGELQFF